MSIVEINGIKIDVDLREAKNVETYKVGDLVKVLVKEYSSFKPYYGVIVGFDAFVNQPTIVVAYLSVGYSEAKVIFAYINESNKEIEITKTDAADLGVERDTVLELIDRDILKNQEEITELQRKRTYFLTHFKQYFKAYAGEEAQK